MYEHDTAWLKCQWASIYRKLLRHWNTHHCCHILQSVCVRNPSHHKTLECLTTGSPFLDPEMVEESIPVDFIEVQSPLLNYVVFQKSMFITLQSGKILNTTYALSHVSDPNFVQKLPFTDVLILASQTVLFNTSYRTRWKIVQCFGQGCKRYQKGGAKGYFQGVFWTLARPG